MRQSDQGFIVVLGGSQPGIHKSL